MTTQPQKITFGEKRASGVRDDHRCSHHIAISADRWPDHVQLSEIEWDFCMARKCGRADILACCPDFDRRKLGVALAVYTRCIMYLRGAGAARIDLDGNACGEVSARDAEHAAEILASRQARRLRPWRPRTRRGSRNRGR